jgi:hypothetical protein
MSKTECLLITSRKHGFFSNYLHTLDAIIYAEKRKLIPIVEWGMRDDFLYKDMEYEKSTEITNCLEYYFEPIKLVPENGKIIDKVNNFTNDNNVPFCFMKTGGHPTNKINFQTFPLIRKDISKVIEKYFVVKQNILDRVDNFHRTYFRGNKVLSIHIRGTDRKSEISTRSNSKVENYILILKKYIQNYDRLFVCSDSWETINILKQEYGERVIFLDSFRKNEHNSEESIHFSNGNYKTGEDVLCEAILMSKSDFLINSDSNVTLASLYMNPELLFQYYDYSTLTL